MLSPHKLAFDTIGKWLTFALLTGCFIQTSRSVVSSRSLLPSVSVFIQQIFMKNILWAKDLMGFRGNPCFQKTLGRHGDPDFGVVWAEAWQGTSEMALGVHTLPQILTRNPPQHTTV